MNNLKKLLNPQQYKAVTTIHGPVLILAGAGTGKTRVITYRIAYMIHKGIEPSSILAVTFTNKAAREMKERVGALLRKQSNRSKPVISTFHSLGLRILREDIHHLGYRSAFSIYDEADQLSLIKKVVEDVWPHLMDRINAKNVAVAISRYKDKFIDPVTAEKKAKDPDSIVNATIYKEYQHRLRQYNAVDFDDLISLPLRLFNEFPQVLEKFQQRYKYIMIDEFQDTNHPQFLFTRHIAGAYKNICVVGDDDQSIYGWRGADYKNILEFDANFPNTLVIKLEQNYRSTQTILDAANSVIKNNLLRREKKLWSTKKNDKPITLLVHNTAREEAESVVTTILDQKLRTGRRFRDFAILIRTNHQSRLFEEQLRKNRIPYVLVGGTRFFDRKEVKDIVAYLKFIMNDNDEMSLMRIINTPTRSIGLATLTALNDYCSEHKIPFVRALRDADNVSKIKQKSAQSIKEFLRIIDIYREKFESGRRVSDLITDFIADIKYEKEVTRISEDRKEIESRMENIREMIEDIHYFENQSDGDRSLKQYLASITLSGKDEDDKDKTKQDTLTLITLHSCKGLEFPIVFMTGMEEGIIPHSRSLEENSGDISEERRLCYVGITRAREQLYLTYCLGRTKYGEVSPSYPSRFLKEIPESLLANADDIISEEDESKIAQFYLDKMKSLVNS